MFKKKESNKATPAPEPVKVAPKPKKELAPKVVEEVVEAKKVAPLKALTETNVR